MLFKSKISFLIVSAYLSLIFVGRSFSQQTTYLDSLDGKFALQFQIDRNFSLSNFQGTIFSGKYHFSQRDAIRLGISIQLADSDVETEVNRLDTTTVDNSKQDDRRFDLTINSQYIHYMSVSDNIAFFGGIGPFFRFFDQNTERLITENGIDIKRESERNGFSTGIDLILGVEWWFHKYMSLSAEYGLKFSYWSSDDKIKDDAIEVVSKTNSFNITGNHINFGITVYF